MYVWLKSWTVKTVILWFLCPLHIKLAVQFWLQMLVYFSFFTVHRRTYYKRRCSKRFSTRTPRGPKNIMQQAGNHPKTGSEMHVACSTVDIFIHFPNNPVFFLLLQAYLLEHLALLKKNSYAFTKLFTKFWESPYLLPNTLAVQYAGIGGRRCHPLGFPSLESDLVKEMQASLPRSFLSTHYIMGSEV